jgi:hypothetical protein
MLWMNRDNVLSVELSLNVAKVTIVPEISSWGVGIPLFTMQGMLPLHIPPQHVSPSPPHEIASFGDLIEILTAKRTRAGLGI